MVSVKISPKFQIAIPLVIRQTLNLKAGEQLCLACYNGRIELIPVKTIRNMRGFIKNMDSKIAREEDRL